MIRALPRLGVQLYAFREQLASDPASVIGRVAEMGITGVEPVCPAGMPEHMRRRFEGWAVDPEELRRLLDDNGLVVTSAHTALPEPPHVDEVLDQQETLGNDCLVISSLERLAGGSITDLEDPQTLERTAERFNRAASVAAQRGMRIGYHNHDWEWKATQDRRPVWDVFWDRLDRSIVAQIDIYWAQLAGITPSSAISALGSRVELLHVKDGPLDRRGPMTAVGTGSVDVREALEAGDHVRWHIIEFDECETDIFQAVEQSVRWLVDNGLSSPE